MSRHVARRGYRGVARRGARGLIAGGAIRGMYNVGRGMYRTLNHYYRTTRRSSSGRRRPSGTAKPSVNIPSATGSAPGGSRRYGRFRGYRRRRKFTRRRKFVTKNLSPLITWQQQETGQCTSAFDAQGLNAPAVMGAYVELNEMLKQSTEMSQKLLGLATQAPVVPMTSVYVQGHSLDLRFSSTSLVTTDISIYVWKCIQNTGVNPSAQWSSDLNNYTRLTTEISNSRPITTNTPGAPLRVAGGSLFKYWRPYKKVNLTLSAGQVFKTSVFVPVRKFFDKTSVG